MVLWSPQKRQEIFLSRFEDEALYGGAAGGGKSEALVVEALRQVHIPHYRALILRKTYPELSELIDKSQRYYRGAFPAAQWSEARHEWRFPSGAKISFGAMQHTNDRFKYQGRAYDYIAFDELTHFTQDEYLYLLSRNRASGPGTRVYLRASANPGGIGHGWVKARFLTPAPPMQTIWEDVSMLTPDGAVLNAKRSRIFVPSTVFDNQILLKNDPAYAARLAALPDADKRALLYGDWDAFAGQVFSEWRADPAHYADRRYTHVPHPQKLAHCPRLRLRLLPSLLGRLVGHQPGRRSVPHPRTLRLHRHAKRGRSLGTRSHRTRNQTNRTGRPQPQRPHRARRG